MNNSDKQVQTKDETFVQRVVRPTDEKVKIKAVHKHSIIAHEAKFLRLAQYTYTDEKGHDRQWDICERTTRNGEVDGIDIVATLKSKTEEPRIILVLQYRPPMRAYTVEFPAGLIDGNEKAEVAALRELQEET
jgi:ADP-ribose pyrophosphatase